MIGHAAFVNELPAAGLCPFMWLMRVAPVHKTALTEGLLPRRVRLLRLGGLDEIRRRQERAKAEPDHEDLRRPYRNGGGLRPAPDRLDDCAVLPTGSRRPEVCDRQRQRSLEERRGNNQRFRQSSDEPVHDASPSCVFDGDFATPHHQARRMKRAKFVLIFAKECLLPTRMIASGINQAHLRNLHRSIS